MTMKFLKGLVSAIALSISAASNAGLIHNDTEWLDLSLTHNITYSELNTLLSGSEYAGYSLATREEVVGLFSEFRDLVMGDHTQNFTYYGISHLTSGFGQDMTDWFRSGISQQGCCYASTPNEGTNYVDTNYNQYLLYGSESNGLFDAGALTFWDTAALGNAEALYYVRSDDYVYELASDVHGKQGTGMNRTFLVTRDVVNVPEPSALALFALGVMGLSLRSRKRRA